MPTPAAIALARPLITRFEGCVLTAYKDPLGIWTIGYGHTGPEVHAGLHITQRQAEEWLDADMASALADVRKRVGIQTPQREAALISFVFNTGGARFEAGTLDDLVRAGKYAQAGAKFSEYVWGHDQHGKAVRLPGLVTRRAAERAVFEGRA